MVLSALLLQRGPAWECLILDSGTTDGSLREVPRGMRVLPLGQPFTHPSSSNAAARAASAPVLVFLSQDALPFLVRVLFEGVSHFFELRRRKIGKQRQRCENVGDRG